MNKSLIHLTILSCAIALAAACGKELDGVETSVPTTQEVVKVSLSVDVPDMITGKPTTKSSTVVRDIPTDIRNLCILQFAGTGNDAPLVGEVHYLVDDPEADDESRLDYDSIRLISSEGSEHTLVLLANTFVSVPRYATLGDMLAQARLVNSQQDIFGYAEEENPYQRMNAVVVSRISGDTHIEASMKRTMARVNVGLTNTGADGLVINSVQLCNVSRRDYYVCDFASFRSQTEPLANESFNYPEDNIAYTPGQAQHVNLTYYVTCNQRGDSELEATYLKISGFYGPDHDRPVVYSYYLGAGDLNNVDPNTSYDLNFSFDGRGDADVDLRISDYGSVDFDVDSNCYMLAPPPAGTGRYSFNVVHRPNTFWGMRYGLCNDPEYSENYIKTSDIWHARIIWSDFEMTKDEASAFLQTTSGNGGGSYMDACQRISVNVPSDHCGGNVLIGIYKDDPEKIIWSWHLWITDYVPDHIGGSKPVDGKYVYSVPGGEVHRYGTAKNDGTETIWASGRRYESAFIMDRNLGATDTKNHGANATTFKYYAFGRKDPFNATCPIWTYANDFTPTKIAKGNPSSIQRSVLNSPEGGNTGGRNMPYTVMNPTVIIGDPGYGGYGHWSSDIFGQTKDINDRLLSWNDPDPADRDADHEEISKGGQYFTDAAHTAIEKRINKSFFDPCPPGWRVPTNTVLEMFYGDANRDATTDPECNFLYGIDASFKARGSGWTYVPLGYLSQKNNAEAQTAFFPQTGMYYCGSSTLFNTTDWCMSTDYHDGSMSKMYSKSPGSGFAGGAAGNCNYTNANTIRCIKEE